MTPLSYLAGEIERGRIVPRHSSLTILDICPILIIKDKGRPARRRALGTGGKDTTMARSRSGGIMTSDGPCRENSFRLRLPSTEATVALPEGDGPC